MEHWKHDLRILGDDLDRHRFPDVHDGGIVRPGNSAVLRFSGQERDDVTRQFERRSSTGSWKRPEGRKGSANSSPSFIGTGFAEHDEEKFSEFYRSELVELRRAYPRAKDWWHPDGFWLLVDGRILGSLQRTVTFVFCMSLFPPHAYQCWAFWDNSRWIGPRHTNFPNGSICAFEPLDGTWLPGDPLVDLFDLYSVWAMRHLHLEIFGRWPGSQSIPSIFERIVEVGPDEFCGCDREPPRRYKDCCFERDRACNQVALAVHFLIHTGGGSRRPPDTVVRFAQRRDDPPTLSEIDLRAVPAA